MSFTLLWMSRKADKRILSEDFHRYNSSMIRHGFLIASGSCLVDWQPKLFGEKELEFRVSK